MQLEVLWKQKQYNEILKRTLNHKPGEFSSEELLICAETLLKNGHRQDALDFYQEANDKNIDFTEINIRHFAQLLIDKGSHEKAYNLLYMASYQDFETKLILYNLQKKLNRSDEEKIVSLRELLDISYQEDLLYDLALLYYSRGEIGRGRRACRQLISFFGSGLWVQKANTLMENPQRVLTTSAESQPIQKPSSKVEQKPAENLSISQIRTESMYKESAPKEQIKKYPNIIEEAFSDMIGMESVKSELLGFYNVIRLQKMREKTLGVVDNSIRSYNFVLYGNPGTGKTTVARIIAKVLYALGIRESDKFFETDRSKLVGQYIGETAQKTKEAINSIRGGTLFVDEAYSLMAKDNEKDFGKEAIDTLLKDIEDNRDSYSVILAGYKEPIKQMLKMNPGFQSRFNYHIEIPDYSDDELLEIAKRNVTAKHYTISESGEQAIRKCIVKARIDETFGNARFIRELINKAEINLANRLSTSEGICPSEMSVFTSVDFIPDEQEEKSEDDLLKELNSLTGLNTVKNVVNNLLATIRVKKEAERRGMSLNGNFGTLHMTFRGNPGTGKTTVARILGQIFNHMGVLKRGDVFIECSRAELVGQYQGHTAQKVKDIVASAMGGILFIDEAYSLVKKSDDSFGLEAVDTLIAEMENHKNDFVVILAGYSDQLDEFLSSNPGFSSRIGFHLTFEDYTSEQMTEIFYNMVKGQKMLIDIKLKNMVKNLLEHASRKNDFGNARGVRNVFEAICRCKDSRVAKELMDGNLVSNEMLITIIKEDIMKVGETFE